MQPREIALALIGPFSFNEGVGGHRRLCSRKGDRINSSTLSRDPLSIALELEHELNRGKSRAEAARAVNLSVGHAQRYRALLQLPPNLQELVRRGELPVMRAAALAGLHETVLQEVRSAAQPRPSQSVTIVAKPGAPGCFRIGRSDRSPTGTPGAASADILHSIASDNPGWLATELRQRCRRWCVDAEWLAPPARTLKDLRSVRRWDEGQRPEFVS